MTRDDRLFLLLAALCLPVNFLAPAPWMMVVKPLPTLWLVWMAHRHTQEKFGRLLVCGVALGAVGDAFLAPVLKDLFVPGAGAFLVGHFFYIAAYLRGNAVQPARLWIALPLALYAGVMSFYVHEAMAARGEGALFVGVAVYMAVLIGTTVIACARRNIDWQIPAGMLVFVVSDSHIAFNNLIFDRPLAILMFTGMLTYYLAQWWIVRGGMCENRALLSARGAPSRAPDESQAR